MREEGNNSAWGAEGREKWDRAASRDSTALARLETVSSGWEDAPPPMHTYTHTHSFLGLSVSGGEKGAVLVLETSGPMAFFARRGLEMAQFPWCEPLGKPQGENEHGGFSLNSKEQLSQPLPRWSRCPRGTAGSRSLSPTHTHIPIHAHTPTHTHTQSLMPIISSYLEPQKETQTRGLL